MDCWSQVLRQRLHQDHYGKVQRNSLGLDDHLADLDTPDSVALAYTSFPSMDLDHQIHQSPVPTTDHLHLQ
jgi:hypothetical protein